MVVRKSWMSAARNSSGHNGRREVKEDLKKEVDFFRDIIIVRYVDSYYPVVQKTVAIYEYAVCRVRGGCNTATLNLNYHSNISCAISMFIYFLFYFVLEGCVVSEKYVK